MSTPIGHITIVHGTAQATGPSGSRPLAQGDPVYQDDEISTGTDSALEIRFTDETVMAQGENARLVLDEYVFNEATGLGALNFDLVQGTFRSATGIIVDNNPAGFELDTPLATIGVRGTTTAHTIPPSWAADETERHVVIVYDGKPVLVIPNGDGTPRLIDTSGRKVEVSEIATSEVTVMTVAEYLYYEQYSSEQLRGQEPAWNSPEEIIDQDPDADRPLTDETMQSGNPADDNLADPDTGNDPDSGDDGGDEEEGESGTLESNTLEGNGLDDLLLSSQILLEDSTLEVSTTESAMSALQSTFGTTSSSNTLLTFTTTPTTTTTTSALQTVSFSSGSTTLTAAQVSSGFVASAPSGAGTFSVTVSSSTPPAAGTSVTADFSSFASNQVVQFDASSITSTSAGYFTVTGGGASDVISGTNHNTDGDTIYGGQGDDTLNGYIGNDVIYGGDGNDTIYGNYSGEGGGSGSDNDTIYGQAGRDSLYGNQGDDIFVYSASSEVVSGEIIDGGSGSDTIRVDGDTSFSDLDFTYNVTGVEYLALTAGVTASFDASQINDLTNLWGISGADNGLDTVETVAFHASSGDTLSVNNLGEFFTNWGNEDTMEGHGAAGAETFVGSWLRDVFYGYDGNDQFTMNDGNDEVYGGAGTDTINFGTGYTDEDIVDGGDGYYDALTFTSDGTTTYTLANVTGVERLMLGDATTSIELSGAFGLVEGLFEIDAGSLTSTSNLSVDASNFQEGIHISAGSGTDTVIGSATYDSFSYTSGRLTAADSLDGGGGFDELTVSGSATDLSGILNMTTITIEEANDGNLNLTLLDHQTADSDSVTVNGSALSDLQSASTLTFDASDELGASFTFTGGVGDDSLFGGGGNDTFTGGKGADTLSGGGGSDTFRYVNTNEAGDTINDFTSGEDTLWFNSSYFSSSFSFHTNFYEGNYDSYGLGVGAAFVYDQATGKLWYDSDGEGQLAETLVATLHDDDSALALAQNDIVVEAGW